MKRLFSLESTQTKESPQNINKNLIIRQFTNADVFLIDISTYNKPIHDLKIETFQTNKKGIIELRNKLDLIILEYNKK